MAGACCRSKGEKTVKNVIAGLLVVSSIFIGAGIASAGSSVVNSEKQYMSGQVGAQVQVGLKWRSCSSGGQCATTNGGVSARETTATLILGAYPKGISVEVTDEKVNNSIVASMDAAADKIILHYAGNRIVHWLSGLGKPPFDATKHFGAWSVRAIASNSNNGTSVFDLTRTN
jgi:hypothetical protein